MQVWCNKCNCKFIVIYLGVYLLFIVLLIKVSIANFTVIWGVNFKFYCYCCQLWAVLSALAFLTYEILLIIYRLDGWENLIWLRWQLISNYFPKAFSNNKHHCLLRSYVWVTLSLFNQPLLSTFCFLLQIVYGVPTT